MVTELADDDAESVVALWITSELTRPWNDPLADFRRAMDGATSTVLGIKDEDRVIGTVMVGNDGHRGWMYYVAVSPAHRRAGLGRLLVDAAEAWLRESGAIKVQLMVRSENDAAMEFYRAAGYERGEVEVLSRWIEK
ncbi:MAG: GNAT family acetyltransferase [Acidimicrobiales bacterium]